MMGAFSGTISSFCRRAPTMEPTSPSGTVMFMLRITSGRFMAL